MHKSYMVMNGRSLGLDAVRAFCCYAIVFHHMVFPGLDFGGGIMERCLVAGLRYFLWTLPTLFLLSSYLMMRGYSRLSYKRKLVSRLKRLVIPFLAFNSMFVILFAGTQNYFSMRTMMSVLGGLPVPADSPMWYIRTLMMLFMISPVVCYSMKFRLGQVIVVLLSIVWSLLSTILGLDVTLHKVFPSYAVILFAIGSVLAVKKIDLCAFAIEHRRLFLTIGLLGGLPLCLNIHNGLALSFPAFFWLAVSDKLELLLNTGRLRWLMDMSFFAYGIHIAIRELMVPLFASIPRAMPGMHLMLTFVLFFLVVAITALLWRLLNKWGGVLSRVFNGTL